MNNFLKYTIITGLFIISFIPLFVDNSLFFPFITGKAFAFRIIVEIIFALWIILMMRDKKYVPKFSWMSVGLTAFTLVILVADLLGVSPLRSIWSNFERMEGWMTIIHIWAYFIVLISLLDSKKMWHRFFNVNLVVSLIISIYGILQLAHLAEIHQGSTRLDASLGNAEYLAVYMLFQAFFAWYLMSVAWAKRQTALAWMYGASGILSSFILYETSTRGTTLGLAGGIGLALLIYAIFAKNSASKYTKTLRWISAGIIVLIIAVGATIWLSRDTAFVKGNPTLYRLASISWKDTQTQARGYIWPMAIKGAFENPKTAIIGWGQENFNYIFNTYYNPKMWSQEQWFDRAHNVFLDWLVAGGILGLVLYLALFIMSFVYLWKSDLTIAEKAIFTGLLAGYFVHVIFVFDNLASYMLFGAVLGFISFLSQKKPIGWLEKLNPTTENTIIVRDYVYSPILLIILLVCVYFVNVRPIQANTRLITALRVCSSPNNQSAALYSNALTLNEYVANQEIREQLISCGNGVVSSQTVPNQTKIDFYTTVKTEMEKQLSVTPNDAREYLFAGGFFNNVGDYVSAEPLLEKAHALSPAKQTITFELSSLYMNIGSTTQALALIKNAYESAPDNPDAKMGYIVTLIVAGQEKTAYTLFGDTPDLFVDQRVINAYARLKNYPKVIELYKKLILKNPEDPQPYLSLTGTYLQTDDLYDAGQELRAIKVKFPQATDQVDILLKQIDAGQNPLKQPQS